VGQRSPNVPNPGYVVVPGWLQVPAGAVIGECVGVEVDAHNHVFFFTRADKGWGNTTLIDKDTVFTVDGDTGQVLASWGKNLFLVPHGLTVDQNDDVWVTDVELNQAFKFTHDGQLLLTVGAGNACGCPGAINAFNQPTDVAVAPSGNVYVSDGYGNARVAKLDPTGAFTAQWGMEGIVP